jgi:hypothetical protein
MAIRLQEALMFYVYVYRDPRLTKQRQVVYVGKGTGDRMYAHWTKRVSKNKGFGAFLALLRRLELAPIVEKVSEFEDEAEAFVEEMRLIALHGRRDLNTGTLFNLTDGGEGFVNAVRTEEWRNNISAALSTSEQRSRQSFATAACWAKPEWRAKTTEAIRQALKDPEVIARREAGKAAFVRTEAFRQTMSAATTKMWQDPEYAARVVEAQRQAQKTESVQVKKSVNSKAMWAKKGEAIATSIKAARASNESKTKTSKQAKAQWANPDYAAKQTASNKEIANREEVKAAKAAAAKALWADPEWKAKMLAARKKKLA